MAMRNNTGEGWASRSDNQRRFDAAKSWYSIPVKLTNFLTLENKKRTTAEFFTKN